jgi:uncharacterized protein (TIGR00369 family)
VKREFLPTDDGFEDRVRNSFARQRLMTTLGARLEQIGPGTVTIGLAHQDSLTQQHGYLHAGVVSAIADSACGYAAFSLMPNDAAVLTVEFKINLLAPADGDRFEARGWVIKRGRTVTICQADVVTTRDGTERTVATMLATLMTVRGRPGMTG